LICLTVHRRETAPEILADYLAKVGGKDLILGQWREKKAGGGKGKKRGRASTASAANGTPAKKGRKNGSHPASSTPPAGAKESDFKPPTGSWEGEVVGIDACEGSAGNVVVYLTWKGGQKTQHPLAQVYKRCPQKVRNHGFPWQYYAN
jgi:chromobox protein 1